MCNFKVGDKVKTRNGRDVEIVHIDGRLKQPIIGLLVWEDGDVVSMAWYEDGTYIKGRSDGTLDIIPPSRTVTLYQAIVRTPEGRYFIPDKLYQGENSDGFQYFKDGGYKVVRLLTEYPIEVEE